MCESWRMGSIVWKALAASSAVVATLVATKVADQIWKTTGQDDIDPADPESPILQAVAYAALTGLIDMTGRYDHRACVELDKAAEYYENSAGHLPKGLETSH